MENSELYDIFTSNREKLGEFLKSNCEYEHLKKLLINMEMNNGMNESIIKKAFIGTVGLESNKQKAIYELPTNELLSIIQFICEFRNLKHIEEIAAGQGLLSYLLKNKLSDEYIINATDGNRWMETSSATRYYEVNNKLVLKHCLENELNFDDKLVIISWLPLIDINDFKKLFEVKKPKNIILIGNSKKYTQLFQNNNYKVVEIPVKQICYLDYFEKNKYLNERSSKSSLIFATNDNDFNMAPLLLTIKLKYNECLFKLTKNITSEMVISDVIATKFQTQMIFQDENFSDETIMEMANSLNYILTHKINIPSYLKTYDEYIFWFKKQKQGLFPSLINNENKFKEYVDLLENFKLENCLEYFKDNGIIPTWVISKEIAEKCIFLDYSTTNKKWKLSDREFRFQFRQTQRPIRQYSYQNFNLEENYYGF